VVKEVHDQALLELLVGPPPSKAEIEAFRAKLSPIPPTILPATWLIDRTDLGRKRVLALATDLRPFVLVSSKEINVVPAACRVAMKDGSLVVNSSQGGGTKDTWVADR